MPFAGVRTEHDLVADLGERACYARDNLEGDSRTLSPDRQVLDQRAGLARTLGPPKLRAEGQSEIAVGLDDDSWPALGWLSPLVQVELLAIDLGDRSTDRSARDDLTHLGEAVIEELAMLELLLRVLPVRKQHRGASRGVHGAHAAPAADVIRVLCELSPVGGPP